MAKVYPNSMAAKAGFVEIVDANDATVYKYQRMLPGLRRVDYGDNREYLVQYGDTWQGIALQLLGTAELWWLIAEFNRVKDPFTELTPGRRLIVPSVARARVVLSDERA